MVIPDTIKFLKKAVRFRLSAFHIAIRGIARRKKEIGTNAERRDFTKYTESPNMVRFQSLMKQSKERIVSEAYPTYFTGPKPSLTKDGNVRLNEVAAVTQ